MTTVSVANCVTHHKGKQGDMHAAAAGGSKGEEGDDTTAHSTPSNATSHDSKRWRGWGAHKATHPTTEGSEQKPAQCRTTRKALPRTTTTCQAMKGWLVRAGPARSARGIGVVAAKSASALQKAPTAARHATESTKS